MSPFYAYAIGISASTGSPYQTSSGHNYVITFTTRATADQWWRAITDAAQTDSNYKGITRVTPQHYTWDTSKSPQVNSTISNTYKAQSFYNRVFFSLFSGPLSVIPDIDITDYISGNSYFIRSKIDPTLYWSVNESSKVLASKSQRSKFRVSFADSDKNKSNNVMIDSDLIKITLAFEACGCDKNIAVFQGSDGKLVIQNAATNFKFGDITKGGFEVEDVTTGKSDAKAIVKASEGERWELVN